MGGGGGGGRQSDKSRCSDCRRWGRTALNRTAAEQETQHTEKDEHATRRDPHSCVP